MWFKVSGSDRWLKGKKVENCLYSLDNGTLTDKEPHDFVELPAKPCGSVGVERIRELLSGSEAEEIEVETEHGLVFAVPRVVLRKALYANVALLFFSDDLTGGKVLYLFGKGGMVHLAQVEE